MEQLLSHDEQSMREKILQHEFPFDPKAWEAMQGLLYEQDRTLPPPPPPSAPPSAPPSGPKPGPGTNGRLKWIFLLLLLALGAGSMTLILKNTASRKPVHTNTGASNAETAFDINDKRRGSTSTPEETPGQPAATESFEKNSASYASARGNHVGVQEKAPGASADSGSARNSVRKNDTAVSKKTGGATLSKAATGLPGPAISASATHTSSIPEAGSISVLEKETNTVPPSSAAIPQPAFLPFTAIPLLPGIPADTLAVPLRPDSIIRPVPYQPISESRRERGWIFGGNLNAVDYRPLRFSALPHLGYFWRYRLQPRTTVQGELVLKFVSGYDWRAEFFDMVPGGSAQVILENKRLLYIEVPLVVQRAYAPGQSWQIGLKPALTLPIAPYGSNSGTNFGASRRNYSAHEGIRYLDMGLVLGWEYRFNRRWALDIRYNQGLFDLTVDNFYRQRETHLNSDIQVSLRHFITKKTKKHEPKTLFPAPPAGR